MRSLQSHGRHALHMLFIALTLAAVTAGCSARDTSTASLASLEGGRLSSDYIASEHMLPESAPVAEASPGLPADPAAFAMLQVSEEPTSHAASILPVPSLVNVAATPVQPHLVKTVEIYLQADDVRAQSTALQSLTTELGGYLSALNENSSLLDRSIIQVTIRVPALRLDEAMERIEALGKVQQRTLNTTDVTLSFVDMQSRMRNLEKTESRLLAHLDRSSDMSSILKVESEIDRVRGEIETLQGRINDLGNQIGFATIRVTLNANPSAGPVTPAGAFSTGKTFTDALRNLLAFAQGLWFIIIWIAVWSPVWIPLAIIARYIYRRTAAIQPANKQAPTTSNQQP